jgi:hypothetical protein
MIAMTNLPVLSAFLVDMFQAHRFKGSVLSPAQGMVHCTSIEIPPSEKKKPAPKTRSRLRQVNEDHRLFGSPAVLFWRIRGFASPGYPGFALIASTNYASCVELFFCDCMDYRYRTADMR